MAPNLTAWLDEREREAKAANLIRDVFGECQAGESGWLTDYVSNWGQPDTALRVLRALRAAQAHQEWEIAASTGKCPRCGEGVEQTCMGIIRPMSEPTDLDTVNWFQCGACSWGKKAGRAYGTVRGCLVRDELRDALDALPGVKP